MKNQISLKVNEQERRELEDLKEFLNIRDCYGDDPKAYKTAVRIALEYLNKAIPYFTLYERLFIDDRKSLFKDRLLPIERVDFRKALEKARKSNT